MEFHEELFNQALKNVEAGEPPEQVIEELALNPRWIEIIAIYMKLSKHSLASALGAIAHFGFLVGQEYERLQRERPVN